MSSGIIHHVLTFLAFACTLGAVPILSALYIAVQVCKRIWMRVLGNRFPHLVFVETSSIRTLLDTHKNQGVFNVLMTIKGTCQMSLIRQALEETIVEKKDRSGKLRFPKLRASLMSCWGNYAWSMATPFRLENHLIEGSPTFRGRFINDQNIQEYVSDIVSKHLPSELSPWQVVVIPRVVSSENKYCILVKVHHLLVEDGESLSIGDFLFLKPEVGRKLDQKITHSPLSDLVSQPTAIPTLYYRINDSLCNRWNEFISVYDPVESSDIMKSPPGFFHSSALLVIAFISVCKEFNKYHNGTSNDPATFLTNFIKAFQSETSRRNVTFFSYLSSIFITFHPKKVFIKSVQCVWWICLTVYLKIPIFIYSECMAFLSSVNPQYFSYQNDLVAIVNDYIKLLYLVAKEIVYIAKIVYTAPIMLIEELLLSDRNSKTNQLQTMSTCGRKVTAWSNSVPSKLIAEIAKVTRVSETEVLLAMTTNCIKEFFVQTNNPIPKIVLATARTVSCDTLLASVENNGENPNKAPGMVCLSLPVRSSGTRYDLSEILNVAKEVKRVRACQKALFALGEWRVHVADAIPSILARVALNCGSRKFSVAITEVAENHQQPRETRWGHTCTELLCWRPPQGNISMSLTIQRYSGLVRLGVMSDQLLAPLHLIPARHWTRVARRLQTRLPHSSTAMVTVL